MNKGRIRLDPSGFNRSVEEGYADQWNGKRLYDLYTQDPKDPAAKLNQTVPFWNPGGGDYLLPFPRQFNPRWFTDSRLQYHTLKTALWTFASGTYVLSYVPPDKNPSGSTYPHNEWIGVYVRASAVSLDSCDYFALGTAAGVTLPDGTKTVAVCGQTPIGTELGASGYSSNYTPYMQAVLYPAPDNVFLYGWSHFAVLLFGSGCYILRSPTGTKQDWELIGKFRNVPTRDFKLTEGTHFNEYFEDPGRTRETVVSVFTAQRGEDEFWFDFCPGSAGAVRWRPATPFGGPVVPVPDGPWWIAGGADQKLDFHAEIVGYEHTDSNGIFPVFFDFGSLAPTQTPQVEPIMLFHLTAGETLDASSGVSGDTYTADSGEHITVGLFDQQNPGTFWSSNGVMFRGEFYLALHPNNPGATNCGFLAPQLKLLEIRFPELLTPRIHNELILYDVLSNAGPAYDGWAATASYYDPEHGQIKIVLRQEASDGIESNGFDGRFGFPIVYEETPVVGPPDWQPCWVAWCEEVQREDLTTVTHAGAPGARRYTIKAKPILSRSDVKWINGFRIINPAGHGQIEHTFAIESVLGSAHFDTTDANAVEIYPDPYSGMERAALPGTWGTYKGVSSDDKDDPWGPTWSETKLGYLKRIAREWAGWVLYSNLRGKVFYHPDLPISLSVNENAYWPTMTLYKTIQDAEAAGVNPKQVWTEIEHDLIRPKGNVVVIHGKNDDDKPAKVVNRDVPAVENINYENFSGEEQPYVVVSRKGVGIPALTQLAVMLLRRIRRKRIIRKFKVDLAPWDLEVIEGADFFDVGHAFTAQSQGDFICTHISVQCQSRGNYTTVITGEKVPSSSFAGVFFGDFPGQGAG